MVLNSLVNRPEEGPIFGRINSITQNEKKNPPLQLSSLFYCVSNVRAHKTVPFYPLNRFSLLHFSFHGSGGDGKLNCVLGPRLVPSRPYSPYLFVGQTSPEIRKVSKAAFTITFTSSYCPILWRNASRKNGKLKIYVMGVVRKCSLFFSFITFLSQFLTKPSTNCPASLASLARTTSYETTSVR